jgi:hypothetical protein
MAQAIPDPPPLTTIDESLHTPYLSPTSSHWAPTSSTASTSPSTNPRRRRVGRPSHWTGSSTSSPKGVLHGAYQPWSEAPIDRRGFRRAIYVVDIGQNHMSAFMRMPYHQVLAKVPNVEVHINYIVDALYSHDTCRFWIHDTCVLGCLCRGSWPSRGTTTPTAASRPTTSSCPGSTRYSKRPVTCSGSAWWTPPSSSSTCLPSSMTWWSTT